MKIATIIFTFNRPEHTKKTLDTLEKNEELSKSVVGGIHYVLQYFDAVIVLEDDCSTHPKFMTYMIQALNKYYFSEKIYSIGGCSWPVYLQNKEIDAYFCGRISSWGWGTWRNRWEQYEEDYTILKRIKANPITNKRLGIWGSDLESTLLGNISGKCDSWAVFWALKVIEKEGICLSPFESLVYNTGTDGSGTHTSMIRIDRKYRETDNKEDYVLPSNITIEKNVEKEFQIHLKGLVAKDREKLLNQLLCKWVSYKTKGKKLKKLPDKIAVWGKGMLFDLLLEEYQGETEVAYIIESYPHSESYCGIPVIVCGQLPIEINIIVALPFWIKEEIIYKVLKENIQAKLIWIDELIEG